MQKLNCWEIMNCGREPGGLNTDELGVCHAATDTSSDKTNEGINGGRVCWSVAGTLSGRDVCGHYAKNTPSCMTCKVFKQIRSEEGSNFNITQVNLRTASPVLHRIYLYNYARFEMQQADSND
jgi:hypothetical protein